MATIVTRAAKGSPLTHVEVDANFTNLNTDKVESSALATVATTGAYADLTGTPTAYTDAAVDTHLNTGTATTGEVLSWTGTDYDWIAAGGGSALELYAENPSSPTAPSATGTNAVAIGTGAVASGNNSTALGRANAGGTDSFAAAIGNVTTTYGAQATGSISIGTLSKATIIAGTAVGYGATSTHQASSAFGYGATTTANNQIALGGSGVTARISGAYTLPTTDGTNGQVLTTDGSGAVTFATAGGGGASASTVVTKPDAYTVGSSDLGYILIFTGSFNEYATLGSAATLGSGFYVTIINQSGNTHIINRTGSDTFTNNGSTGDTSYKLASGASVTLVSDGTSKWLSKNIAPYLYAECNNNSGDFNPVATGSGAVALGRSASASGVTSFAAGANSGYGGSTATGAGAVALGGSYASGADSFAAAVANNTSTYGATGSNSVAIGQQAKASGLRAVAIGYSALATATRSYALSAYGNATQAYGATLFGARAASSVQGKAAYGPAYLVGQGEVQGGMLVCTVQTTDATASTLTTTNDSASTTNQVILPNNSAYFFSGTIIAREQASAGTDVGAWEIKGAIRREANAASTVLVKSTIDDFNVPTGWAVALTADTTNGGLAITVTGAAATNIRWVATVNTSEVTY